MPLDYKTSYKSKVKRKRRLTTAIIILILLAATGLILYISQKNNGSAEIPEYLQGWNPLNTGLDKKGKPLERQALYLYTIGIPRVSPADVNREYQRAEITVEDSYFEDALFIGDSRTEGFMMYSSLANINAYCSKGLSVSRIYTDAIVPMEDGRTVTVMEALQEQKYKKIYIMFGVNELGWPYDELFEEQYSKVVQDVKSLQPDALIYVQNIIPISAARSATDPVYNNSNVARFNGMIESVCEQQNVIYLDVASALADDSGALPEGASVDGIHCNGEYCDKWLEYLKNNTYELKPVAAEKYEESKEAGSFGEESIEGV